MNHFLQFVGAIQHKAAGLVLGKVRRILDADLLPVARNDRIDLDAARLLRVQVIPHTVALQAGLVRQHGLCGRNRRAF